MRFQELIRACPQHDMENWKILSRFYDALSVATRQILDNGGPFLLLSTEEAYEKISVLAKYSQKYHEDKRKLEKNEDEESKDEEIRYLRAQLEGTDRKIEKLTNTLNALALGCVVCGGNHVLDDCPQNCSKLTTNGDEEEVMLSREEEWEESNFVDYKGQRQLQGRAIRQNQGFLGTDSQLYPSDPFARLESLIEKYVVNSSKRHDDTEFVLKTQQASIQTIEERIEKIAQTLEKKISVEPSIPKVADVECQGITIRSGKNLPGPVIPKDKSSKEQQDKAEERNEEERDLGTNRAAPTETRVAPVEQNPESLKNDVTRVAPVEPRAALVQ